MSKKGSWDNEWTIEESLGSGGHGDTYLVTRKDNDDNKLFVLKKLRNQKSLERRERMHREVCSLKRLNHPNIPKVCDANTDKYLDIGVPLYFVSDYIKGQTLENFIENSTLDLTIAVNLTLKLTAIVKYCHDSGTHHRDIKPDNIILRNDDVKDPVLIDFGQSFNDDDELESRLTKPSQQLGNRFLHLPELQIGDSEKRFVESDITQCCGILFYTLTGVYPVNLSDHTDRKPHERPSVAKLFGSLPSNVNLKLFEVFNKGFESRIENRFRSFGTLTGRLHEVLDELKIVSEKADMTDSRIEHLFEDIVLLVDEMVERTDYAGAAAIARSFLGLEKPDKALQIVERIEERGGKEHPNYFIVLANKAYVMNHLKDYEMVIQVTDKLTQELKKRGEQLTAYHALVRANAFMCRGDVSNAIKWVERAKASQQYSNEREKSKKLYPTLAEFLTED